MKRTTAPYARRVDGDSSDDGDKGKKDQGDSGGGRGKSSDDDGKDTGGDKDTTQSGKGGADDNTKDSSKDDKANDAAASEGKAAEAEPAKAAEAEPAKAAPMPAAEPAPEPTRPTDSEFAELPPARFIVPGNPNDNAPPPGQAPPGDSRSYRRMAEGKEEFLLLYRSNCFLITRRGPVGKLGTWNVIEYPNQGASAHAYAQECSTLRGEGFYDFYG